MRLSRPRRDHKVGAILQTRETAQYQQDLAAPKHIWQAFAAANASIPSSSEPGRLGSIAATRLRSRRSSQGSPQTIEKRNLPGLQFAPGGFVGEEACPIDFWKVLIFSGTRRPFQFEQI
jgi:hypothetical protein